jgi:hypothetical protein
MPLGRRAAIKVPLEQQHGWLVYNTKIMNFFYYKLLFASFIIRDDILSYGFHLLLTLSVLFFYL